MMATKKLTDKELRHAAAIGVAGLDALFNVRGRQEDEDNPKVLAMALLMMLDSALRIGDEYTLDDLRAELKEWQSSVRAYNSRVEGSS